MILQWIRHAMILLIVASPNCHDVSAFSVPTMPTFSRPIISTYILTKSDDIVGKCYELEPQLSNDHDDEVAEWYPTALKTFFFEGASSCVTVRRTSFSCSKLGYTVWPSSLVLCMDSIAENIRNKRVMELGAGVGLPSVVFRDVLHARAVLATDFWYEEGDEFDEKRLIPEKWHRVNLAYNVQDGKKNASIQKLDFFKPETVVKARDSFQPDLVVGSDVVYFPDDLPHLYRAIEILVDGANGCKNIILVSPLPPEHREALPRFRDWLKRKALDGVFDLETTEYALHENEVGERTERFLKMLIRVPAENRQV